MDWVEMKVKMKVFDEIKTANQNIEQLAESLAVFL